MSGHQMTNNYGNGLNLNFNPFGIRDPKKLAIGVILVVALFAFEMFNFDTTRFALQSLLGEEKFLWFQWAAILAIAFCSIDFAGLVRLFTPEKGFDEPKEVWYLMGAWMLGATMNAVMTWWAVSLTLLNHSFGNEVLSREQLLLYVPIFVAVLVWLTRILFIGAFTVAGEHFFDFHGEEKVNNNGRSRSPQAKIPATQPQRTQVQRTRPQRSQARQPRQGAPKRAAPKPASAIAPTTPAFVDEYDQTPRPTAVRPPAPQVRKAPKQYPKRQPQNSRIRQRPPMPSGVMRNSGIQAKRRN